MGKYFKSFSNPGTYKCANPVKDEPQARNSDRARKSPAKESSQLTQWKEEGAGTAAVKQLHGRAVSTQRGCGFWCQPRRHPSTPPPPPREVHRVPQKPQVPARMPCRGPRTKEKLPAPRTHKSRTGNKPGERVPAGRLSPRGDCKSPRERAGTQPTRPHGCGSWGRPAALRGPRTGASRTAYALGAAKHLPALFFFERPREARPGAARRGGQSQTLGCSPGEREQARFFRPRGRQKPCSALMGPHPLRCGVSVTARRAGVSPRRRREPGRLYDLQLG